MNRLAGEIRLDLLHGQAVVNLVGFGGDEAEMRRADRVIEFEQRMVGIEDRFIFVDVDSGESRPPRFQAVDQAPSSINFARLVLTSSAVGFMRAKSARVTMPRVSRTIGKCKVKISDSAKNSARLAATS